VRADNYRAIGAMLPIRKNGKIMPDPESRIMMTLAHAIAESRSCFNTKLLSIFANAGYELRSFKPADSKTHFKDMQIAAVEMKDIKESKVEDGAYIEAIEYFQEQATRGELDCEDELNRTKTKIDSMEDNYRAEVFMLMNRFKLKSLPLISTSTWLLLLRKPHFMTSIKLYNATMKTAPVLFELDTNTFDNANLPIIAPLLHPTVAAFHDALKMIGLTNHMDLESEINVNLKKTQKEALKLQLDKINCFRGKLSIPKDASPHVIISRLLNAFGRTLKRHTSRTGSAREGDRVSKTVYKMELLGVGDMCISELAGHLQPRKYEVDIEARALEADIDIRPNKRQKT
jgi:hypothetical protein